MTTTRSLVRAALAASIVLPAVVLAVAQPVRADDDDPLPGEGGSDIAVPSLESEQQVSDLAVARAEPLVEAQSMPTIDDFWYDDLETEGTAAEVCYGSLRPGTLGVYRAITSRFGGSPGTMYYCRERYAVHERPECNGQVADPVTMPDFFSDCWSNHAQGRAMDIMVGRSGGGWNQARGNAIVNWLLATDSAGNVAANARRLGVQQILWNDRCWNSDGDRGIVSATSMRVCGYGHFDHVHVDLSLYGANGWTSWWGHAPRRLPKENGLFFRDYQSGRWGVQSWVNLRVAARLESAWSPNWTQSVTGDWDRNGARNDLFVSNAQTGHWIVVAWSGVNRQTIFSGRWSAAFDRFVNGDFDSDGRSNDMIALDTQTGYHEMWTWTASGPIRTGTGTWSPRWDTLVAIDWDSNGVVNETFLVDRQTGEWWVNRWNGRIRWAKESGQWSSKWDRFVPADLDAQGNLDDMFVFDGATGDYMLVGWSRSGGVGRGRGTISAGWDHFVMGDYDTDGRVDDMYVRDNQTGRWVIWSWHRYRATQPMDRTWTTRWDEYAAGVFG